MAAVSPNAFENWQANELPAAAAGKVDNTSFEYWQGGQLPGIEAAGGGYAPPPPVLFRVAWARNANRVIKVM